MKRFKIMITAPDGSVFSTIEKCVGHNPSMAAIKCLQRWHRQTGWTTRLTLPSIESLRSQLRGNTTTKSVTLLGGEIIYVQINKPDEGN